MTTVTLAPTGDGRTWILTIDGKPVGEYLDGNSWRIRREAFNTLADDHDMLIVWEPNGAGEPGFAGQSFERVPCDDGCPIGPRGHATVVLTGEQDYTCTQFKRAQQALDLANQESERRRAQRAAGE